MNFEIGHVVQLKSGGPLMTVSYVGNAGKLTCVWFNETNGAFENKWAEFQPEMLKAK